MTDSISFGNGKNAGKIDLKKVKAGLTKQEIAGNNKKLQSIFDKVDSNIRDGVLDQTELENFYNELNKLAGDDNHLTDDEAKGFKDSKGNKMGRRHRKAFYEFLNKLAANEQEPQAAAQLPAPELQAPQTKAADLVEIPETIQTTVTAQNADEIVPDSETISSETVNEETVVPEEVEKEPEPEVTTGIIVQNGESPAVIAKKFGVSVEDLLAANEGAVKGKGNKKYFLVGAEIVIPRKIEDEELAELTKNRKSAAETTGDYAQAMAVREQRRAQQQAENEALGLKNRNGAGTKITGKYKGGETEEFTVIGEAGRGRKVAKTKSGKIVTIAHDGTILTESYVQNTNFYDRKDTKKVTVNGKQYAVAGSRGDKHGRSIAVDSNGNQVVLSSDGKVLRNDYVSATDARDAGASRATLTGGKNVTYVKDANGKVWYFDEKTGKALVKDQHAAMVKKEADQVAQDLLDGANYTWGTNEKKIEKGIRNIYSPEIMASVNNTLKSKDSTYTGDSMTKPVEALLLDELSRSEVRSHIKTLAANGAYGTGAAMDAALGRNAAREIKYEVHGGLGITTTKDLKDAMSLVSTRGARLKAEKYFEKGEVKGQQNEGSWIRQYIAEDGYNAQEVDLFDAKWIENGAYDHKNDQEHRNTVTGRLVFEYGNKESLQAGLEAIDTDTADYQYISARAAEENKTKGYQAHFNGQEALQTYIAGRNTQEDGAVDTKEISACNTKLYKLEKPIRIQAEEALYGAKKGDFSNMFDSMDPKVYEEMADMLADGEVSGCKDIKEAYEKALNSATTGNDKTHLKANAILSGQIEFSDAEIADFCVELMHSIDSNKGKGGSSDESAEYTNTADYMTEQLKAILQANPQVIANVKEQVENGTFKSTKLINQASGTNQNGIQQFVKQNVTIDTKEAYLALINDSKHVANEAVFYDKDGNQITNPEEIAALTNANMQALQGMRDYIAQLERDFKKGVDAEGGLSNMANDLVGYSGLGTDRDDVANAYRNAKLMLAQLEAAAQGKLRDSEGNVVSAQDLAQKIIETQDGLAQTNSNYQSSIQTAKMGIILAPVIVATTVATMGTGALLATGTGASLGLATTTGTTYALTGAGVLTANLVGGTVAGAATYGLNAYEYNSSLTGNTAEAREQNAIDSAVAGVSTFIGAQQMGPISKLFNNANAFVRGGGRLTTVLASDVGVGAAGEYVQTGTVTVNGVAMNAIFSATGNFIGIKSLAKKADIPANTPHVEINNHPSHDAEIDKLTQSIADIDKQIKRAESNFALKERRGKQVTLQEKQQLERMKSNRAAKQAELDALQKPAAEPEVVVKPDDAEPVAKVEDAEPVVKPEEAEPVAKVEDAEPVVKVEDAEPVVTPEEIPNRFNKKSPKEIAQDNTPISELSVDELIAKRDAIETLRANGEAKPASFRAEDGVSVIHSDEYYQTSKAIEQALNDKGVINVEPHVTPENVPSPENIVRDAQAIPEASIPAEYRSLWKSCQERIGKIFSTGRALAMGEVKTVLADIKKFYNAVTNVKTRTQLKKIYNKVVAHAKSKQASKPAVADTPSTGTNKPSSPKQTANYNVPDEFHLISEKNGIKIYRTDEYNGYCREIEVTTKNGKSLKVAERQLEDEKVTSRTDYTYDNNNTLTQAITRDKSNIIVRNQVVDPDGISIIYDCENGYVYADRPIAGEKSDRVAYELPLDKLRMAAEGKNPGITANNIAELGNLPEGKIKYGEPFQRVTTDEEADAVFRDFVQRKSTRTTLDMNDGYYVIRTTGDKNAEFKMVDGWAKHYTKAEQGTPWKIHIYADSPTEWANSAQLCMPYLDKHGLVYKTISNFADLQALAVDTQRGKAFTVYFKDEAAFLQTAKDLDKIFSNSGMKSSGTVANDAQIGNSGFLSYRNENSSRYGAYKPKDTEDPYLNMIAQQNASPAAAPRGMSSVEERVMVNDIIGDINSAKTPAAIDKIQVKLDRLPESSPYKTDLQRQLREKGRVLGGAADPANNPTPVRTSEPAKPANSAAKADWQMSADSRSRGFQRNASAETNITTLTPDEVSVSGNATGYSHFVGPTANSLGVNADIYSGICNNLQNGQPYSVYNAEANVTAIGVPNLDSFNRPGLFQVLVKGQVSEADATALMKILKDKNLIPNMKDSFTPEVKAKVKQVQEVTAEYFNSKNTIEAEPYFVDVSEQAEIVAEPVPADYDGPIHEVNEHGDFVVTAEDADVILVEPAAITTRPTREISKDIDMASTDFEFDNIQKEIDTITDPVKKYELQKKLDKKRQELDNNIVMLEDIEEINPTYGNNENEFNEAILQDEMEHYNSFDEGIDLADDMGGFDPF